MVAKVHFDLLGRDPDLLQTIQSPNGLQKATLVLPLPGNVRLRYDGIATDAHTLLQVRALAEGFDGDPTTSEVPESSDRTYFHRGLQPGYGNWATWHDGDRNIEFDVTGIVRAWLNEEIPEFGLQVQPSEFDVLNLDYVFDDALATVHGVPVLVLETR